MNDASLSEYIRKAVPGLIALYRFGSQAKGTARPASDIDLAILSREPVPNLRRFELAQELATQLHRDVDLVDLHTASAVMKMQVLSTGGVHHEFPKDKDRLAMPVPLSLVLASFFFFVFLPVTGKNIWLFFPGFLSGYSSYLFIHYAVHRFRQPRNFLSILWKHHALHHYKSEDTAFGVTFPLWDHIFKTMPTDKDKRDAAIDQKLPDYQGYL
ncbi:MAG: hypothetical protein HP494_15485 [Nitrospira sp.]|nr:hypothetical protein [Nitrospira sp.]